MTYCIYIIREQTDCFNGIINLLLELSFVTLTIHLSNGLNDKNLVKPRKMCFNCFMCKAWFTLPITSTRSSRLPKVPDRTRSMACTRLLLERYSIIPDSRTSAQDSYTTSTRLTIRSLLEHTDLNRIPSRSVHQQLD